MSNTENRKAFARAMGSTLGEPHLKNLMRHCKTYHRLMEAECNGCLREKSKLETWEEFDKSRVLQMEWVAKRVVQIETLICRHAKAIGWDNVLFEGDPRGPTVRFSKVPFSKEWFNESMRYDVINADVWNW